MTKSKDKLEKSKKDLKESTKLASLKPKDKGRKKSEDTKKCSKKRRKVLKEKE